MRPVAAGLLLWALAAPALPANEPLGRLFFTPAQRNTLDAGKQLDRPKTAGPVVRGPHSLMVNGIVTRSDGESTVWVNGAAASIKRQGAATITATPSNAVTAHVQVTGTSAKLRVGQVLNRSTGKITESYETRQASGRKRTANTAPAAEAGSRDTVSEAPAADNEPARR